MNFEQAHRLDNLHVSGTRVVFSKCAELAAQNIPVTALMLGEAALALARRGGRTRDMAIAENNLTWHEIREGDLAAARRRLAAVDELAGDCGELRLRAVALARRGGHVRQRGGIWWC